MVTNGRTYLVILLIAFAFAACDKKTDNTTYPFTISFQNKAGNTDLILADTYTNLFGEIIKITTFKYYITNISVVTNTGSVIAIPETYYLVDQNIPSSLHFTVNTTADKIQALRFLIGVDSTHNVSGVQTGALDPVNAMFWTWNTGYIMAKLEGKSPQSTQPLTAVTYHIGGFKTGENTVHPVSLSLPTPLLLSTTATSEVIINADAMKWFNGVNAIKIADNAYTATPGPLAVSISENYATMFSVGEVINR